MDSSPMTPMTDLDWSNVGLGIAFIAFNVVISQALQLHLGASLGIAALRCTVQLTLVATVLQHVFAAKKWWMVAMIARTSYFPSTRGIVFIITCMVVP